MDQRRAHKDMTYFEAKRFLMQRYHTTPSKTVVASKLRQITYKETEDFDKYYDKVMLLLDRLQADMPPDVRAGYLLTGITSASLRDKLCNFDMDTPEKLRNAVLTVLHNMFEVRRLTEAEKDVRINVKEAEANVNVVVVDEKAWVNRFNDLVCSDCGEVGHTRRQCSSFSKLPQAYTSIITTTITTKVWLEPRLTSPKGPNMQMNQNQGGGVLLRRGNRMPLKERSVRRQTSRGSHKAYRFQSTRGIHPLIHRSCR
ncbi:hypothetical protein RvY_01687 [Ramazzottius varieornatus]|uniref:CCHC-type domain-containing protein n=1 Tax=Ramazzottius varieornatus TaxID=947166 RepID=A0A1D1URV7_RAMVA|nr:hypothetical protein RvY_01687 [Ramazzottius varieornatus]